MSDLAEFLRARLDADAAEIAKQPDDAGEPLGAIGIWSSGDVISNTEYLILSKKRALREVEGKRRIITEYEEVSEWLNRPENRQHPAGEAHGLHTALKLLALPYADEPDYDESWRP